MKFKKEKEDKVVTLDFLLTEDTYTNICAYLCNENDEVEILSNY